MNYEHKCYTWVVHEPVRGNSKLENAEAKGMVISVSSNTQVYKKG